MPHGTRSYYIQKELYTKYTAQMSEVNATEFKRRLRLLMKDYQTWVNKNYIPNWRFERTEESKKRYQKEFEVLRRENNSLKFGQQILRAASHKAVNSKLGDAV